MLVIIAITGGFVFHVGPLRVSAHSSWTPLALALLAWAAAIARGRVPASTAAAELLPLLERHAAAVAVVAAVAAAGVGVAHGTYAAAGADASGYMSEAALLASGRVVRDQPFARTVTWPDGTSTVSPLGYRPGRQIGELVPTYPPGLALAMAVATVTAGEWGAYLVVPLLGAFGRVVYLSAPLSPRATGQLVNCSPPRTCCRTHARMPRSCCRVNRLPSHWPLPRSSSSLYGRRG